LGARIHDALESPPLADKAEGLIPRLDQTSAEKALERRSRLAMRLDELLFVAGFHSETHHVESGHVAPLLIIPISTSKIQECGSSIWAWAVFATRRRRPTPPIIPEVNPMPAGPSSAGSWRWRPCRQQTPESRSS